MSRPPAAYDASFGRSAWRRRYKRSQERDTSAAASRGIRAHQIGFRQPWIINGHSAAYQKL